MALLFDSLAPVFLVIVAGYGLRRVLALERAVWAGLERLAYYALFPALLVRTLAGADIALGAAWRLIAVTVGALCLAGAAATAARRPFGLTGPRFASVFQGATRFNTYVILGVSGALLGTRGLTLAAVPLAFMIVVGNILAVTVLLRHGASSGSNAARPSLLVSLAGNPLILACAAGLALNGAGIALPGALDAALELIGSAAVAVGLLSVGAALAPRRLLADGREVALTATLKLIVQPAAAVALIVLLGLDGPARAVAIVCACVPVATSAYILSTQLGGDADLMARLITLTTLASVVTMPAWLLLAIGAF